MNPADFRGSVYAAVRRIPRGRVATYGQIAALAGVPGAARQVGRALFQLDSDTVPWHRVVNAEGRVAISANPDAARLQRRLLESEGVVFGAAGSIPLEEYLWRPRGRPRTRPTPSAPAPDSRGRRGGRAPR